MCLQEMLFCCVSSSMLRGPLDRVPDAFDTSRLSQPPSHSVSVSLSFSRLFLIDLAGAPSVLPGCTLENPVRYMLSSPVYLVNTTRNWSGLLKLASSCSYTTPDKKPATYVCTAQKLSRVWSRVDPSTLSVPFSTATCDCDIGGLLLKSLSRA